LKRTPDTIAAAATTLTPRTPPDERQLRVRDRLKAGRVDHDAAPEDEDCDRYSPKEELFALGGIAI
jgi:hypothetical protein